MKYFQYLQPEVLCGGYLKTREIVIMVTAFAMANKINDGDDLVDCPTDLMRIIIVATMTLMMLIVMMIVIMLSA